MMKKIAFWNNKGGTGKTSLAFQTVCFYGRAHPNARILVVDVCPQANLSELLLGGLVNKGSNNLLAQQAKTVRATVGGYFQLRLPSPFSPNQFRCADFITQVDQYNKYVPANIDLFCGDPLLELQVNAISTLSATQVPGTDTWNAVIAWLSDFLDRVEDSYDVVFIDTNPSFSIYTQIALSVADELLLPVMADDSSRRAVENAFSLIYGLKLPSEIYAQHNFSTRLLAGNRKLPRVRAVLKNRLTQYMGPESAYAAVLQTIERSVESLQKQNPEYFVDGGTRFVDIRDFQTTGVVAHARGCPFFELAIGRVDVGDRRVRINQVNLTNCIKAMDLVVASLSDDKPKPKPKPKPG